MVWDFVFPWFSRRYSQTESVSLMKTMTKFQEGHDFLSGDEVLLIFFFYSFNIWSIVKIFFKTVVHI